METDRKDNKWKIYILSLGRVMKTRRTTMKHLRIISFEFQEKSMSRLTASKDNTEGKKSVLTLDAVMEWKFNYKTRLFAVAPPAVPSATVVKIL